jgi:hypothetical protein
LNYKAPFLLDLGFLHSNNFANGDGMSNQINNTSDGTAAESPKWFNSPISYYEGSIDSIRHHIPNFERRTFALTDPSAELSWLNQRLDTIVRKPTPDDKTFVPVGVVSKEYVLIPHNEVVDIAERALRSANIDPRLVWAELDITEYGERMNLSLYLPDNFTFDPGDGNRMALRLELFNSVEGSTRFRALMGWFRFVCSNGLIIGITKSDFRRRHIGNLRVSDVSTVLLSGIKESEAEIRNFGVWREKSIQPKTLRNWIEDHLKKYWGFKAATRTYHIATSGYDINIVGQYKDKTPLTIRVKGAKRVPGTPKSSQNLFDISQILAWLAKERRDVQEQLIWREQIPEILKPLMS